MLADEARKVSGKRSAKITVESMQDFFLDEERKTRKLPSELFERALGARDLGPLPPPNPLNPDVLLARVDPGV
jgi:hypothetical protein